MSLSNILQPNAYPAFFLNNQVQSAVAISGATTLGKNDSGCVLSVSNAGSAYSITLPAVAGAAGYNFNFCFASAPNAAITIAAGSACIYGQIQDLTSGFNTAIASHSNLIVGTSAVRGTQIRLWSDGTSYFAQCISLVSGSITDS